VASAGADAARVLTGLLLVYAPQLLGFIASTHTNTRGLTRLLVLVLLLLCLCVRRKCWASLHQRTNSKQP
jgi:hypothetical protein